MICIRFAEPLVFGDYPKSMKESVKERLPAFTEEEKTSLKGSFDFLGINYYLSGFAKNEPNPSPQAMLPHEIDAKASDQGKNITFILNRSIKENT